MKTFEVVYKNFAVDGGWVFKEFSKFTQFWPVPLPPIKNVKSLDAHETDYRHRDDVNGLVMVLLARNLMVFVFCCSRQAEPLILTSDHDLNFWPWPWYLTLTSKQGKWLQTMKSKHLQSPLIFTLTFDLQYQASQGQGRHSWKIKVIGQMVLVSTDRWALPSTWSPCFAKAMRSIIKWARRVSGEGIFYTNPKL